jgi:hypothetical protein
MKHAWACLLVIGCGTSGEPINGDVSIHYGTDTPKFVVGAAVQDRNKPANMLVQIGSDNVDCSTYLDVFFTLSDPSGTFVYFSVDKTTPGTQAQNTVAVMQSDGNHTSINESTGTVTIDAIGKRVTGSVTFMTTDTMIGAIVVSGSFDVLSCL